MKLKIKLNEAEETVEVVRKGDLLHVTRGAETTTVRLLQEEGAAFLLERVGVENNSAARVRAAGISLDNGRRQLWVNGQLFAYERIPERAAPREQGGDTSLSATIPAIVAQVLVDVGREVRAGDKLILLESMKMVIPIEAPYDGIVTAVNCAAGESVQPGVPLAVLERAARDEDGHGHG